MKEALDGVRPRSPEGYSLFSLLDGDERAVLAGQVELRSFAARERIYKMGEPAPQAYVLHFR